MYISKNIKHLRLNRKLSQEALATILGLSAKTSVSNYENGNSLPNLETVISLCKYFNTDPNTILLCDMQAENITAGHVDMHDILKQHNAKEIASTNNNTNEIEMLNKKIADIANFEQPFCMSAPSRATQYLFRPMQTTQSSVNSPVRFAVGRIKPFSRCYQHLFANKMFHVIMLIYAPQYCY